MYCSYIIAGDSISICLTIVYLRLIITNHIKHYAYIYKYIKYKKFKIKKFEIQIGMQIFFFF